MRYLKVGLTECDPERATPGFTIISPMYQRKTVLLNMSGEVVHEWDLPAQPANYARLLTNGNMFVATKLDDGPADLSGKGGLIQEYDWDGNVIWEYRDTHQHHDLHRLPNGNVVYLAWELLPEEIAGQVKGGKPGSEYMGGVWGDVVREVNPEGELVWEWRASENVDFSNCPPLPGSSTRKEYAHANALYPLDDGNVLISYRINSTIAIIDRKTGQYAWQRRDPDWGGQHDATMLENGNILLFANRLNAGTWRGSQVLEIDPDNEVPVWEYKASPGHTFDSHFISGAQRLWSGNTLICEGLWGRIFEVTPEGGVVWEYVSPYFTPDNPGERRSNVNFVFRAYRYSEDSPEIAGRLNGRVS